MTHETELLCEPPRYAWRWKCTCGATYGGFLNQQQCAESAERHKDV